MFCTLYDDYHHLHNHQSLMKTCADHVTWSSKVLICMFPIETCWINRETVLLKKSRCGHAVISDRQLLYHQADDLADVEVICFIVICLKHIIKSIWNCKSSGLFSLHPLLNRILHVVPYYISDHQFLFWHFSSHLGRYKWNITPLASWTTSHLCTMLHYNCFTRHVENIANLRENLKIYVKPSSHTIILKRIYVWSLAC